MGNGKRMAALIGDYYHEPGPLRSALEELVTGNEIDFFTDPFQAPWDRLMDYGVLLVAREGRINPAESSAVWYTERHENAIAAFVRAGGGLVGLHAGLASYKHGGAYGSTLHGTFFSHPEEHPEFRLRSTGAPHPVLSDFSELSLRDEMYFVRVDAGATTRLLETWSPDYGSSTAAWAHQCGAGRVFCLTPGHRPEVLQDPGYRAFLARGVLWVQQRLP